MSRRSGRYEEILGRVIIERREVVRLERERAKCERLASPEHQRVELADRYADLERRRADLGDHERHVRSRDEVRRTRYHAEGKELSDIASQYSAAIEQRLMALSNLASKSRLPVPTTVHAEASEARTVDQAMSSAQTAIDRADSFGRLVGGGSREPPLTKWPPLVRDLLVYVPAGVVTLLLLFVVYVVAAAVPGLGSWLLLIDFVLPAGVAGGAILLRDWMMTAPATRDPGQRHARLALICCYAGLAIHLLLTS